MIVDHRRVNECEQTKARMLRAFAYSHNKPGVIIMATIILVACLSTVIFHFIRKPAKRRNCKDNYQALKFERSRREMAIARNTVYW